MMFKHLRSFLLPLAVSLPLSALAGPFTSMFVFGDSLSDTGNLAVISPANGPNPANGPYDGGRFSNGPLWIEGLATGLGLSGQAAPVILGGNNYAFAGARTGTAGSVPGVLSQAAGLWGPGNAPWGLPAHLSADPNALYVVVGGGNDMRDARSLYAGVTPADMAGHAAAAATAIANLANTIGYLASKGAKNVLISTMPDLGYTPEAILMGLTAASSDASAWFNGDIPGLMGFGASLGLHMNLLDMAGLASDIQLHPADFGITNISWPCAGFLYSQGVGCDQSAFSDVLHPSAHVGSLFALAALDVLGVPEPSTLALFALAVLALLVTRRRSLVVGWSVVAVLASGCAEMSDTQRSTAIGAGVGTLAGAAIGRSGQSAVIGAGVGALGGYIWSTQMAAKKAAMEQATAGTGVDVTQTADNQLKLNIPSDISFDTGRADIKSNLQPILDQFAQGLNNQPNTEIRIVGHTDSTGSDAVNNPLSINRAASARDYLASRGVDSHRIQIEGRGSREPIGDNNTDAGRAKNRRIEMFLAERAATAK